MDENKKHYEQGKDSAGKFRTRKSDRVAGVLVVVVALNTWKLHDAMDDLIEAERSKTQKLVAEARGYTDKKYSDLQYQLEKGFRDIKEWLAEQSADIRELRVEVLRRGSK